MKKFLLWLFVGLMVVSIISVFSLGGCKAAPAEEAAPEQEIHDIAMMPFHLPCMWFGPYTAGGYWYLEQK